MIKDKIEIINENLGVKINMPAVTRPNHYGSVDDNIHVVESYGKIISEAYGITDPKRIATVSKMYGVFSRHIAEADTKTKQQVLKGLLTDSHLVSEDLGYMNITPQYIGGGTNPAYPQAPTSNNLSSISTSAYQFGTGDNPALATSMAMRTAAQTIGLELLHNGVMVMNNATYQFLDGVYAGSNVTGTLNDAIRQYYDLRGGIIGDTFDYSKLPAQNGYIVLVPANSAGNATVDGTGVLALFSQKGRVNSEIKIRVINYGSYTASTNTTVYTGLTQNLETVLASSAYWAISKFGGNPSAAFRDAATLQYIGTRPTATAPTVVDDTLIQAANSLGNTLSPMDKATGESGNPQIITLKRWSASVAANEYSITASSNKQDETDYMKMGVDSNAYLLDRAYDQVSQSLNYNITDSLFKLGVTSAAKMKVAHGLNMNLYFAPVASTSKALSAFGVKKFDDIDGVSQVGKFTSVVNAESGSPSESYMIRQRHICSRIRAVKALVTHMSRNGEPDFLVTNVQIGTVLEDVKGFIYSMDNRVNNAGLYKAGTLYGLDVYIDPIMPANDTRILVGRRGGESDSGLKFLTYDMVERAVMSEGTMTKKILVAMRYALMPVGFYPELNYFTFCVNSDFGALA